jgi:hypothetical protein
MVSSFPRRPPPSSVIVVNSIVRLTGLGSTSVGAAASALKNAPWTTIEERKKLGERGFIDVKL